MLFPIFIWIVLGYLTTSI